MKLERMTIIVSLFILLFISYTSIAQTTNEDISALTNIANLRADAYINARDKFILSSSGPIDINEAVDKGWKEGLLALIINARIVEPKLFDGWDIGGFRRDASGVPFWDPGLYKSNKKQGQYCELFRMEVI